MKTFKIGDRVTVQGADDFNGQSGSVVGTKVNLFSKLLYLVKLDGWHKPMSFYPREIIEVPLQVKVS